MRLFLVTHAETDWTTVGRFQGHTDIPLNAQGKQQAELLQQRLAQELLDAIVASDLRRALETAMIIATPHGLPVQTDPRLRELHFGDWEGLTYAEVYQKDPHGLAAWQHNLLEFSTPGGERLPALADRLHDFLHDLMSRLPDRQVLVVAHRGSVRVMLCLLLGIPVQNLWQFRLDVASLTEVRVSAEKVEVLRLNEHQSESEAQHDR